jgi:MFS transporter, AAHS family, benzoate transport protein
MAGEPEIQLSRLLDERGLSGFQVRVLVWSILIAVIDGYDIAVAGVALPSIMKDMGVDASTAG